tara:strand:- start:153 stop:383 length:231 start_codon:yes stop_codon:yes gene_type:complete
MGGQGLMGLSRAGLAGLLTAVALYFIGNPDTWYNYLGVACIAGAVMWFVLEVFQGPEIADDRIVAQELFRQLLKEE